MGLETLPSSMLACQIVEFNKPYKIHQIPTPRTLNPHDLLVKVAVASLCHTDGMVSAGIMGTPLPCTASHEGTGTVVALGSSAASAHPDGFSEGDRVMCGLYRDQCGICADCLGDEAYKQYCANSKGAIGVNTDGNFAEYVVIDARNAAKLPEKVSFETAAPMACAGSTVYRGVLQAKLTSHEWLAIVGSGGGLGHLGIQFAKAMGLNVVGIDARDEGLALSRECGADVTIDARKGKEHIVAEVHKVTSGAGADATVNVSDAENAAATACAVTKRHGLVIQIAQPENISIPFPELIFRDIRIQGSLICSPKESREMVEVVAKHNISVKTNPFHGLDKIPELVELAHGGKMQGKGIVIVDEDQVKAEKKPGLTLV
ncbi:MAG: hypothetical protein M1828_000158 [Chrysothrix sp. TS-e1954]|nr:MAG: hypothetical protein M1828_000158 [Chrysothrix sp. TS-e1954]